MAVLVILCLLIGVGKNVIGFVYLFEILFRLCITGIHIGMIFLCQLAVCFFYFIVPRALLEAEDFIIVTFICHFSISLRNGNWTDLPRGVNLSSFFTLIATGEVF